MRNERIFAAHLEKQTFEGVHRNLRRSVYEYLFHLNGRKEDLEDIVQEIFIKLWINWLKVQTMKEDELKNYVFIILKNHITNERRQNNRPRRNKRMFLNEYSKVYVPYYWHDDALVAEGMEIHRKAIDQLADMERVAYLYHINDYSAEEIATIVNRSECTVHNNLSAAYKKVKTYLNKNYGFNLHTGRRNYCKSVSLN